MVHDKYDNTINYNNNNDLTYSNKIILLNVRLLIIWIVKLIFFSYLIFSIIKRHEWFNISFFIFSFGSIYSGIILIKYHKYSKKYWKLNYINGIVNVIPLINNLGIFLVICCLILEKKYNKKLLKLKNN